MTCPLCIVSRIHVALHASIIMLACKGKGIVLGKRHTITSGLMTLCILLPVIAIFLYEIHQHSPQISIASIILVITGFVAGSVLPGILTTWITIMLTVIGGGILMFGNVPVALPLKLVLLMIFPASAGLMSIIRHALVQFGWISFDRHDVEKYAKHYDQATKLQTRYNAEKMYRKIVHFIQDDDDQDLWSTITAVHWAHSTQYKQFHAGNYEKTLRDIAAVLKVDRLPSESLYYLDHGTFVIISHQLSKQTYRKRNELTKAHLSELRCMESTPQFKWGSLDIDSSNIHNFPALRDVLKHLQRDMETDLVVEYLKGDDSQ